MGPELGVWGPKGGLAGRGQPGKERWGGLGRVKSQLVPAQPVACQPGDIKTPGVQNTNMLGLS